MKSFIVGLILCISTSVSLFSINSTNTEKGWEDKGPRSRSISPSLSIEDNVVYLCSEAQIDNVCVQIKDLLGNVLYSETISMMAGAEYPISLDAIPQGDYLIVLTQGSNSLTEYFTK